MVDYNSAYTGPQIDAAVALAQTSLQTDDTGWGDYVDTQYTSAAPFSVSADTDTLLPNNKGTVIETQKPNDVTTFYDGSAITGRNGDAILITIDCNLKPTNVNTTVAEFWIDIGGALGQLYRRITTFPKGVGIERALNFTVAAYTLGTWQANGGVVYIRANGSLDVYDIRYVITRTHKAR
jgi:hypothetical protein